MSHVSLPVQDTKDFIKLKKDVFDVPFNEHVVHQVIVSILANQRLQTVRRKSKAQVAGSGRKIRRQRGGRGMGTARLGTIRNPLLRKGGVSFAPNDRSYHKKINKRMYQTAVKMVFSQLIREDRIVVFKEIMLEKAKTKLFSAFLVQCISDKKVIFLGDDFSREVLLSSRNLPGVCLFDSWNVSTFIRLVSYPKVIITTSFLSKIEDLLC